MLKYTCNAYVHFIYLEHSPLLSNSGHTHTCQSKCANKRIMHWAIRSCQSCWQFLQTDTIQLQWQAKQVWAVSSTSHYSWPKAFDTVGRGSRVGLTYLLMRGTRHGKVAQCSLLSCIKLKSFRFKTYTCTFTPSCKRIWTVIILCTWGGEGSSSQCCITKIHTSKILEKLSETQDSVHFLKSLGKMHALTMAIHDIL